MTHSVHFTSCSRLYKTILSLFTHPYAILDLYDWGFFSYNDEMQCLRVIELQNVQKHIKICVLKQAKN